MLSTVVNRRGLLFCMYFNFITKESLVTCDVNANYLKLIVKNLADRFCGKNIFNGRFFRTVVHGVKGNEILYQ